MACNCGIVVVNNPHNPPTGQPCKTGCLIAKSLKVPCGQGPGACNDILEIDLSEYVVAGSDIGALKYSLSDTKDLDSPKNTARPYSSLSVSPQGLLQMTTDRALSPETSIVRVVYKVKEENGIHSNFGYIDVCIDDPCYGKDREICDPCTGETLTQTGNLVLSSSGGKATPSKSTIKLS